MIHEPELARRDYIGDLTDSTRWNSFAPRSGDVVVVTPPKSGTTWTQGILALLISGDPGVDTQLADKSPWIDIKIGELTEVMEALEAQEHLRHVKTHTPMDGIPIWPDLRYITVYRHPIDVHFSYRKHAANMKREENVELLQVPEDPSESFHEWLKSENQDGACLTAIANHYRCALDREPRENFLRLHYADMLRDLAGAVSQIAAHVGISHSSEVMASLTEAATFANMKANADRFTPGAGMDFWHKDAAFFDSATSNKWEDVLTGADLAAYEARISALLSPEERVWLEWGDAAV